MLRPRRRRLRSWRTGGWFPTRWIDSMTGATARCRRPASGGEARRACAVEAARGRGAGVGRGLGRASVGDRGAIRARPRGAIVGLGPHSVKIGSVAYPYRPIVLNILGHYSCYYIQCFECHNPHGHIPLLSQKGKKKEKTWPHS